MAIISHPKLDPAEFVALQQDAGWTLPIEFIGGEAVVMPPSSRHAAAAQGELFYALRRWQDTTGDGGLLMQRVFVRFVGEQSAAPDIVWWSAGRRPRLADGRFEVTPDLAVEVLSPKARGNDLGAKRELYLASGVEELWLVDPLARTVTRVSADGGEVVFSTRDILVSAQLPGFEFETARIFAH